MIANRQIESDIRRMKFESSSSPKMKTAMPPVSLFQAEDGIRDADVTGVQTCALPISALEMTAGDAMNARPRTIAARELAARALAVLEAEKITSLVVVDSAGVVEGVLHLHDLWGMELI